jgi:hypothetical protein
MRAFHNAGVQRSREAVRRVTAEKARPIHQTSAAAEARCAVPVCSSPGRWPRWAS